MSSRTRVAALLVVPLVAVVAACGSGGSSDSTPKSSGNAECTYTDDGREAAKKVDLPPGTPVTKKPTTVNISTNRGDIKATLNGDTTPCTVNSFLSLAKQGYFDDTKCHRLHITDYFVLQCGDPTGSGSGGPGYSFDDELEGAKAQADGEAWGETKTKVYAAGLKLVQGIAAEGIGTPSNNPQLGPGDGTPKNPVIIQSVK